MDITLVKVFPVHEEKLKAFVSVVFDSCFMVNDIKIIQGKDGLFLSMPSRRKKTGEFKDVAHPLNNSFRRLLEERVLGEYRQMVDDVTPRRPDREGEEDEDGAATGDASPGALSGEEGGEGAPRQATSSKDGAGQVAPSRQAQPAGGAAGKPSGDDVSQEGGDAGPRDHQASGNGAENVDDGHEPSLEEVQQKHLQDSFWSVRGRS